MSLRPKSSPAKALRQRSSTKCLQQVTPVKLEQRCGSAASMRRAEANKHAKSVSSRVSSSTGSTSVKTKGKEIRKVASRRNCKAQSPDTNCTMYKAYGSTTETKPDNLESQVDPLNPYGEMLKKVQESVKEKMELINFQAAVENESERETTLKENQPQESRKATEESKDTMRESKDKTVSKGKEDQEEDEDDDEQGIPQVIRSLEPQGDPDTELELIKALHLATMEETAKTVKPKKMLKHFRESGYFNWDYQEHSRATSDNQNLKNGLKKGLERLYTVLALQGPSSHCTLNAK